MTQEKQNLHVVRQKFEAAWNEGDLTALIDLIGDGYVGHATPHEMTLTGREQLEQRIALYRDLFPELEFEIQDQFCSGDRVCTRWMARLEKDPETARRDSVSGEPIRLGGITISLLQGGKIVEEWDTWDTLALFESSTRPDVLDAIRLSI